MALNQHMKVFNTEICGTREEFIENLEKNGWNRNASWSLQFQFAKIVINIYDDEDDTDNDGVHTSLIQHFVYAITFSVEEEIESAQMLFEKLLNKKYSTTSVDEAGLSQVLKSIRAFKIYTLYENELGYVVYEPEDKDGYLSLTYISKCGLEQLSNEEDELLKLI